MSIYKDCDIRGVYGEDLTEEIMEGMGRAIAKILDGRSIVVGGDFRTHTPQLKKALIDGLLESGAEVYDVGQVSTPQLYFSKRELETYASAQVTASHNPPKYNGLKLMFGDLPVLPADIYEVERVAEEGDFPTGAGTLAKRDTTLAYETMLRAAFGTLERPLRIVVDAGNGAMSVVAPEVAKSVGLDVVPLFCSYDGNFPNRGPNPAVLSNLTKLSAAVRKEGADFGVAFDGDGDRAIFVDGEGTPLMAEEALVLFVNHLVKPGDSVVYDLKCSSILKSAIEKRGGTPIMERSGHAFIRRHFIKEDSRLAGEVSGHYFFRELEGDDGLFALMIMARIMTGTGKTMRDLLGDVTYTSITPDIRVQATPEEIDEVFGRMEAWAKDEGIEPVRLDGIRLEFADGGWALLRRSITEPAFTVRLEAPTQTELDQLKEKAASILGVPQILG